MSKLYDNIKKLCDDVGVKPATMCRAVGLSPNMPTELKSGRKTSVRAETAQRIADYFGITVGELLHGKDTVDESAVLEKCIDLLKRRPVLRTLVLAYETLADEDIEASIHFVERMRNA